MSMLEKFEPDATPGALDGDAAVFVPQISVGAFTLLETTRRTFMAASADRRMSRVTFACAPGGIDAAIRKGADGRMPKALLVEVADDADTLLAKLDCLAELCPPDTIVIVLGACNDVTLYRSLKRRGVAEYLVTPVTPLGLMTALGEVLEDGCAVRRAPVTAVFGAQGGCGASTLAQNVAWQLSHECETPVLLIDFDLATGTSAFRLDLEARTTVVTALNEGDRLDKAILDRMLLRNGAGFALLASPADLTDACRYETADIRRLIEVARQTTSHVILDLPSSWSRHVERFLELADRSILVATPDLVSLRNSGRIVQIMGQARPNDAAPHLVLSQVGVPRSRQISPDKFAKSIGLPVRDRIPFDAATFSSAENDGRLVCDSARGSVAAKQFGAVARALGGQDRIGGGSEKTRLLGRLRGLFT